MESHGSSVGIGGYTAGPVDEKANGTAGSIQEIVADSTYKLGYKLGKVTEGLFELHRDNQSALEAFVLLRHAIEDLNKEVHGVDERMSRLDAGSIATVRDEFFTILKSSLESSSKNGGDAIRDWQVVMNLNQNALENRLQLISDQIDHLVHYVNTPWYKRLWIWMKELI